MEHTDRPENDQPQPLTPEDPAGNGAGKGNGQRERRRLFRRQHQGARRAGSRAPAAGDVHRLDRAVRAASSGLRSRRQLHRRGAGRLLRSDQRHHPHRRIGHRHRQRPRHSGGSSRERQVSGRSRADRAARRRQIRQRQLQGFGRTPRRRRLGGERAVRSARSRNLAQRPGVSRSPTSAASRRPRSK